MALQHHAHFLSFVVTVTALSAGCLPLDRAADLVPGEVKGRMAMAASRARLSPLLVRVEALEVSAAAPSASVVSNRAAMRSR